MRWKRMEPLQANGAIWYVWFAWYPVRTTKYWVWLEYVMRRRAKLDQWKDKKARDQTGNYIYMSIDPKHED